MPSNDKTITEEQQTKVKASQAITLLLGDDNKLYYYEGEPNYKDYTSLKETTYQASGCGAAFRGSFGSIRYLLVPAVYRAKYSPLLPLKSWSGSMLWLPMRAS